MVHIYLSETIRTSPSLSVHGEIILEIGFPWIIFPFWPWVASALRVTKRDYKFSDLFTKSELKTIAAALIFQKFDERKGSNASYSFLASLPLYWSFVWDFSHGIQIFWTWICFKNVSFLSPPTLGKDKDDTYLKHIHVQKIWILWEKSQTNDQYKGSDTRKEKLALPPLRSSNFWEIRAAAMG